MREDKIKIGETVICVESGVVGEVIDFYTREGSEKEIEVITPGGNRYRAPERKWRRCVIAIDTVHGKDMTGKMLNPYGEYLLKFARNHGMTTAQASETPTCKARLHFFNETGM